MKFFKKLIDNFINKVTPVELKVLNKDFYFFDTDDNAIMSMVLYILNSKDLRAIEYVDKLIKIGVDSLKIEGRTKSPYYVARTCKSYKKAINDSINNKPFDFQLVSDLSELSNRGYTQGFYDRHPDQDYQNYLDGASNSGTSQLVGVVIGEQNGLAKVEIKNKGY